MKNSEMPINPITRGADFVGLTKREYFAALAMQGIAASDTANLLSAENIASWAADQADALLAELENKQ